MYRIVKKGRTGKITTTSRFLTLFGQGQLTFSKHGFLLSHFFVPRGGTLWVYNEN